MLAGLPSEKVELPYTDVADEGGSSIIFNKKAAEKCDPILENQPYRGKPRN